MPHWKRWHTLCMCACAPGAAQAAATALVKFQPMSCPRPALGAFSFGEQGWEQAAQPQSLALAPSARPLGAALPVQPGCSHQDAPAH